MAGFSTSEEVKRLIALPSKELLKEFTETRERFKTYLKTAGINVPDLILEESGPRQPANLNSVLLDEFTAETISAIDDSVLTIYSTVESFIKLFDILPDSRTLENITVTVAGNPPCTTKDLHDMFLKNSVDKEGQLVIACNDLKSIMPELGLKAKSSKTVEKAAALSDKDLVIEEKAAPPPVEKTEAPPQKSVQKAPAPSAKKAELQVLSPIISQNEYDAIMSGEKIQTAPVEELEASSAGVTEPVKEQEKPFVPPAPQKAAQATMPPFVPPASVSIAESKETSTSGDAMLSQDELDALLSQAPVPKLSVSDDELKAFLKPDELDSGTLSQDSIDSLLAGKEYEGKTPFLSQNELDDLLHAPVQTAAPSTSAPAEEEQSITQDELDALISESKKSKASAPPFVPNVQKPPASEAVTEAASVSQNEIDALLTAPKTAETPVSQDDIVLRYRCFRFN